MKYLATATAALTIAATGAFAESHMPSGPMSLEDMQAMKGDLIRTRDITGGDIYTMNEADDEGWEIESGYNGLNPDWNKIGEIEDVVLSKDGKLIGIVGEIGGFLNIGDKHVMLPVQELRLVAVDDASYSYVTRYNEEQLESLPGVDEGFWD